MRRVAITGFGIVSCLGNSRAEVLDSLRHGRSGIELIPERKQLGFRSALGGRIRNLPPLQLPKRNLRQMGPGTVLAVHATMQALADARLEPAELRNERTGVIIGNVGNMRDVYRQCRMFEDKTQRLGGSAEQKVIGDST